MLRNTKKLYGYKLAALDGDIGHVKDFYFDDKTWVVRYLVADTGTWLPERLVLLSPHAFGHFDEVDGKALPVNLTRKQIEDSPSIESHHPVSRQYEADYYRYYGWPAYWSGGGMWGGGAFPVVTLPVPEGSDGPRYQHREDKHLQSARAVTGYQLQTTDGPIGQVSGFLIDDKSWAIHQLIAETGHWYSGKEILIAPGKVERISYEDSQVFVNLTKAEIR